MTSIENIHPEHPEEHSQEHMDLPPQGRYGLIGREDGLGSLDDSLRQAPIVVLTGPAGIGKTELACGLARNLADGPDAASSDGGADSHPVTRVFFTSFDYGAGLSRVLHEIGTAVWGVDFARGSLERQRQRVIDYLKGSPSLLIWDNFDNIFPSSGDSGGEPGGESEGGIYSEAEVWELLDFLGDLGEGPSRILITCRSRGWAREWAAGRGVTYAHEELGGLRDEGVLQLAEAVLKDAGVDTGNLGAEYMDLLNTLQGNPLSLGVVLPHLKGHSPSELAQALEEYSSLSTGAVTTGEGDSGGAAAALECSFARLSPRAQAHLPFLGLFRQRVLLDVLTHIAQEEVYRTNMGHVLGWGACRALLREARNFGFFDSISPSVYQIPPMITGFLRKRLESSRTPSEMAALEQEFLRVYADLGDYFLENLASDNMESTITGVLAEEANLRQALGLAEANAQWDLAQLALQPLAHVYKMQERIPELRRLREDLLAHIDIDNVPGPDAEGEKRGAAELWMYLQATEINDSIERHEYDKAEGICNAVLEYLGVDPDPQGSVPARPQVASIYHNLGMIAQGRGQNDQAEDWYLRSLRINEHLKNEAESADNYHQLGLIAQSRESYHQALEWHQMALDVRERLEDEGEVGNERFQLAQIAEAGYDFDAAQESYQLARTAYEHVGDQASAAAVYHRLGFIISRVQFDYEEAVGWYQRALLAYEEIGDEVSGADDYYQLGMIAMHRYEYGEAEGWFRQALDAYEKQDNQLAIAYTHDQMGKSAHALRRAADAEDRYQKALELFIRLGDEVAAASTWGQLGMLADQLGNYPYAVWYVAHTYEIAVTHQLPLANQVRRHLAALRSKMGADEFARCWQEISDTDIQSELDQAESE